MCFAKVKGFLWANYVAVVLKLMSEVLLDLEKQALILCKRILVPFRQASAFRLISLDLSTGFSKEHHLDFKHRWTRNPGG